MGLTCTGKVLEVPKPSVIIEFYQIVFIDYWLNLVGVIYKSQVGGDVENF